MGSGQVSSYFIWSYYSFSLSPLSLPIFSFSLSFPFLSLFLSLSHSFSPSLSHSFSPFLSFFLSFSLSATYCLFVIFLSSLNVLWLLHLLNQAFKREIQNLNKLILKIDHYIFVCPFKFLTQTKSLITFVM